MNIDLDKKINLGAILIVFCIVGFSLNEYSTEMARLGQDQVRQFQEVKANLRSESKLVIKYIEVSRVFAENYFRFSRQKKSPWFDQIHYDPKYSGAYLKNVSDEYRKSNLGNLNIISKKYLTDPEKRIEVNMALELGEHFAPGLKAIKSSPWFYYTSTDFMYLAPYTDPKDFFFSSKITEQKEFYFNATPEKNPKREGFWTSVYVDEAGLGLMITYSEPVYDKDQFKGSLSMDVTVDQFNSMVRRDEGAPGTYILFNNLGQVIADPKAVDSKDRKITYASDLLPQDILQKIKDNKPGAQKKFFRQGMNFFIFEDFPELDSTLVFTVSVRQFLTSVLHTTLMLFLVSIFCIFLILKLRRTFIQDYRMQQNFIQNSKMSALGQMAAGMAHEINNPLAIITGKSTALKRKLDHSAEPIDKERVSTDLSTIIQTANRIAKIIRSLQAFSRNAEQDPFIETHLQTWLSEVLELCYRTMDSYAITLKLHDIPNVRFDARESQLSQVMLNLLNNSIDAIKHLDKKEISISFELRDEKIFIYVRDSGPKIPPEVQARMMEPFYTTKPQGVGTGLGLSISLGIMKSHNGNLRLVTDDAQTCFEMEIPKQQPV